MSICLGGTGVWADNPMAGTWRGSNGYKIEIPEGATKFTLTFIDVKGEKIRHPAEWVKVGEEFSWIDKTQSHHTARLEAKHKPIRIRDVSEAWPDSPAYWYR